MQACEKPRREVRRVREAGQQRGGMEQAAPRPRPAPIKAKRTVQGVKGALVKNLERVEKIVERAMRPPGNVGKGARDIADDLHEIQKCESHEAIWTLE